MQLDVSSMFLASPEDFPICRRKCRFHLRRRWRRNSCERRLGILRVPCSINLQLAGARAGAGAGRGWQLDPGTGQVTSVKSVYATTQGQARPGRVSVAIYTSIQGRFRVGAGRDASLSLVSLINCISIIISCSLTSPRSRSGGSVTVSVTSTRSRFVRVLVLVLVLVCR